MEVSMKSPLLLRAALFSFALLLIQTSARAAQYLVTYSGVIGGGAPSNIDTFGLFGAAGANLDGLAYTSRYIVTDPTPGATVTDNGTTREIIGFAGTSPTRATLTIGGVTLVIDSSGFGNAALTNNGFLGSDGINHTASSTEAPGEYALFVSNTIFTPNNFLASTDFAQSFAYSVMPGDFISGGFTASIRDPLTGDLLRSNIFFSPARVVGSAVPEPAQWITMLLGFALVGAAMRRRRWARSFG
jgi:PEP-CTERM motif